MTFQKPIGHLEQESSDQPGAISRFATDIAGVLLTPSDTLRDVGARQAVVPAVLLVMLIVVVSTAGQMVVATLELFQVPGFTSPVAPVFAGTTAAMNLMSLFWNIIWAPVFWTIIAGVIYLVARAMGGNGNFGALWAASGFALTPQLLIAPFTTAGELMALVGGVAQVFGWLVVFPLVIAGFVWTLVLYAIAIRETMGLSTGRAVGTLAILGGVLIGIGILLVCMFMVFMVGIVALMGAA